MHNGYTLFFFGFAFKCSPLFFLIQALVDATNLKGDPDLSTDPFLSLAGLFRAIRKAEDAVDAERTPVCVVDFLLFFPSNIYTHTNKRLFSMQKLHVLSQIGSSFTRSLRSGSISLGHTPDVILLPSAYYKVCIIGQKYDELSYKVWPY